MIAELKKRRMGVPVWLIYVLVLPLLGYLLFQAVLSGTTYVTQYRLHSTIYQWNASKKVPTMIEWSAMEQMALNSLHWNKESVNLNNGIGRLYHYRSVFMELNGNDKLVYGNKALEYYRVVTALRPAWAYGWLNMLITKGHLGQIDAEYEQALMLVLQQAPWDTQTLPLIYRFSLFGWASLDSNSRKILLDYFIKAQESREVNVRRAVTNIGRLSLYCMITGHHGVKATFCP